MINPEKILITCLSTGEIRYIDEAMLLFKTLNVFGGTLSKAKKIACFTKNIDEIYKQKLSHLGVQVKIVDKINSPDVFSSRLQVLTLDEDYEFLVALDTDIIVTNDFSKFLQQDSIGVPIEDDDLLSIRNWKDIFQHFNIEFPKARVNTSFTNLNTIPYFGASVLLVPKMFVKNLYSTWKYYIKELWNNHKKFLDIEQALIYHNIQYAFALTLHDLKMNYNLLPISMNLSTHIGCHKDLIPKFQEPLLMDSRNNGEFLHDYLKPYRKKLSNLDPFLIHYHHRRTSSGHIRYCYYENINKKLDQINREIDPNLDYEMIVDKLYIDVLRRPADNAGLRHYADLLEKKQFDLKSLEIHFRNSEEYTKLIKSGKLIKN